MLIFFVHRPTTSCLWMSAAMITLFIIHQVWQHSFFTQVPSSVNSSQIYSIGDKTTIVTAYFPLTKAKHSKDEYLSWLENFLGYCQSPMVIFTNSEYQPILYRLRRNGSLPFIFIVEYNSPLEMPPIQDLVPVFERQYSTDPERRYHSVELYAIWCAKSFMLNRSAELNPFGTKLFLYVDAGAFRSSQYRFRWWPHPNNTRLVFKNDRFLLGMIAPLPHRFCQLNYTLEQGPIAVNLIEGGFIGGSIRAVRWWTSVFYETIHSYYAKNFFVGKDQYVMNAIALMYPHHFNMMLSFRVSCNDVWFAFGPLLAAQNERKQLSFSETCQKQDLNKIVISFDEICAGINNLT